MIDLLDWYQFRNALKLTAPEESLKAKLVSATVEPVINFDELLVIQVNAVNACKLKERLEKKLVRQGHLALCFVWPFQIQTSKPLLKTPSSASWVDVCNTPLILSPFPLFEIFSQSSSSS